MANKNYAQNNKGRYSSSLGVAPEDIPLRGTYLDYDGRDLRSMGGGPYALAPMPVDWDSVPDSDWRVDWSVKNDNNSRANSKSQSLYEQYKNMEQGKGRITPNTDFNPVRRVARPMNPEANAQVMRYGVDNKLAELEATNPSKYRAIMQAMRENPLEGGRLYSFMPTMAMAGPAMGAAMMSGDPTNMQQALVGGAGMVAGNMAQNLMDAGMVAQPFIDYADYVQRPEFEDERWRQMQMMGE